MLSYIPHNKAFEVHKKRAPQLGRYVYGEINMNRNIIFLIGLASLLSSCQSTGVIPMDQDSYYIGKKDGSPGLGVSLSNKAAVYSEANAFCREKGLVVEVMRETVTPAAPARLGSTELQFKCVASGGTAQPLEKEADAVIEVR